MADWRDVVRARLSALDLSPEREREIVDEWVQHLEQRCDDLMAGGSTRDEARRIVVDEIGGPSDWTNDMRRLRQARVTPPIPVGGPAACFSGLRDDVRLAVRRMRATPIVSATAILSLALGIGANTAIFSIADSLFRRPLPVERPEQLAVVVSQAPGGAARVTWSNPVWEQIRQRRHDLFETAFAYSARVSRFNLARTGVADLVDGVWVSGDYFGGLEVQPVLGRLLSPADDERGAGNNGPVAVISDRLWRSRYAASPEVLGRGVTIDGVPFTIVGVMPAGFFGADVGARFDIAVPLSAEPLMRGSDSYLDRATTSWLAIMARLRTDQQPSQAQGALRAAFPHIRDVTMPRELSAEGQARYLSEPLTVESASIGTSTMRTRYRRPLSVLLVIVTLVLAIACGNIANLQLARALERRQELSLRVAIGASRWRVARQLLVDSFVLAALGAVFGLVLADWLGGVLIRQLTTYTNAVFISVPVDDRVVGYAAIVAVASAFLFGMLPAWFAFRTEPAGALRARGRGGSSQGGRGPAGLLVSGQVAFTVALVIVAGLMARTFASLSSVDLGFDREAVVIAELDLRNSSVAPSGRGAFYAARSAEVAALPGVARAAVSDITPISGRLVDNYVDVDNGPDSPDAMKVAFQNVVTPGWFDTYGTPIVSGRDFDARDRLGATPVAIINETFARRFMDATVPLGHHIRLGGSAPQAPWLEIVGVVGDAAYRSLREQPPPTVYLPLSQAQEVPAIMRLSVRAGVGQPMHLVDSVAAAIARADENVAMTFTPLDQHVDAALVLERMLAMVSGFFGVLALGLAALGIYGTSWYAATRRRRELGIRLALGATAAKVRRLVLARTAVVIGVGVVAGVAGSAWASTSLSALLYGVEPFDLATIASAAAILALVGLLATWIPATRASRIAPADVLRDP